MNKNERMVVVWGEEDILNTSIQYLLSLKKGWNVVCITNQKDLETLITASQTPHAEIVIIVKADQKNAPQFFLQLIQDYPAVKVIAISLKNNTMEVYRKQEILVKQSSDLVSEIENGDSSRSDTEKENGNDYS